MTDYHVTSRGKGFLSTRNNDVVYDVNVNSGAGNDSLHIRDGMSGLIREGLFGSTEYAVPLRWDNIARVDINSGAGADRIRIDAGDDLRIRAGAGNDVVDIGFLGAREISVHLGDGNDRINLPYLQVNARYSDSRIRIDGGDGWDLVNIGGEATIPQSAQRGAGQQLPPVQFSAHTVRKNHDVITTLTIQNRDGDAREIELKNIEQIVIDGNAYAPDHRVSTGLSPVRSALGGR